MHIDNNDLRVEVIEPLRGVAAVAVAWFHFTNGGSLLAEGWLKASGAYGWLGAEVFFVISGFIIPYSMYRGGYVFPRDTGKFLFKRIVRLEPPYLVAVALSLGLWYASAAVPGYQGSPPDASALQVMMHLGYLNTFFGYSWLNPVFWTLAIEFQFYIFAAVAFPLIAHRSPTVSILALLVICAAPLAVQGEAFVFHYGGLFALGVLTFQVFVGLVPSWGYLPLALALAGATTAILGPIVMAAGLLTALTISFVRIRAHAFPVFLGAISYSLYLVHVPVGGRVVNLGAKFADSLTLQAAVLVIAFACSLVAACTMYTFIERPARTWSSAASYGRRSPRQSAATASARRSLPKSGLPSSASHEL